MRRFWLLFVVVLITASLSAPVQADTLPLANLRWAQVINGSIVSVFRYGDSVVLYIEGTKVISFDETTGQEKWVVDVPYDLTTSEGWLFHNWLYINSGSNLRRVNLDSGAVEDLGFNTYHLAFYPTDSGTLYVAGTDRYETGGVRAIDMESFQIQWVYQVSTSPASGDTRLAIGEHAIIASFANEVSALDPVGGHLYWTVPISLDEILAANQNYVFGINKEEKRLYALDITTGLPVWTADIADQFCFSKEYCWFGGVRADVATAYALVSRPGDDGSLDNRLLAFEARSGKLLWVKDMEKQNSFTLPLVLPREGLLVLTPARLTLPPTSGIRLQVTPHGVGLSFKEGQELFFDSVEFLSAATGETLALEKAMMPEQDLTVYEFKDEILRAWGSATPEQTIANASAFVEQGNRDSALATLVALNEADPNGFSQAGGKLHLENFLEKWLDEDEARLNAGAEMIGVPWLQNLQEHWVLNQFGDLVIRTIKGFELGFMLERTSYLQSLRFWRHVGDNWQLPGLRYYYSSIYAPDNLYYVGFGPNYWIEILRYEARIALVKSWMPLFALSTVAPLAFVVMHLRRRTSGIALLKILVLATLSIAMTWVYMLPYLWVGVNPNLLHLQISFMGGPSDGDIFNLQCWSCIQVPIVLLGPPLIAKLMRESKAKATISWFSLIGLCWGNVLILMGRLFLATRG